MVDFGEIIFNYIVKLILGLVEDKINSSTLSFLGKIKVRMRVEKATTEVVEYLVPFLQQEGVAGEKIDRLISTCINELKPYTDKPEDLFRGSLDGHKIFENLYRNKNLPQVVIEDGLVDTYSLLFPRVATLICKIPAAVRDWENEAWSENYRRFDEVFTQLKALFIRVDELANVQKKGADSTLIQFKRILTQKVGLQMDITGLCADQPYSGKFDDFFILPEIKQILKEENGKEDPVSLSIIEPEDCFNNFTSPHHLHVVVGAPGAGKSTWSKWLQRETLKSDWEGIGIRLEFRVLDVNNLPSAYQLIRQVAGQQMHEDLSQERIKIWMEECHLVFILDGFDEVKPSERDLITVWIGEVIEFVKGCPFIITSRPITTDHLERLTGTWQRWSIESFDIARITAYIGKWYTNSPLLSDTNTTINADALANDWYSDSTVGPLTGNPLLLSTLLMVHHLDGRLPKGRANLYKRYIDGMLGFWEERHRRSASDIEIDPQTKRKIISGLALHLFLLEEDTINEEALIEWLNTFLPNIGVKVQPMEIIQILLERTGLIIGPGIYNFLHKTIAEYLVAEVIFQGDQQDNNGNSLNLFYLYNHREEDRWNTVTFLWAGIASVNDVSSFIYECLRSGSWSLAYGLLLDLYNRFTPKIRKKYILRIQEIKEPESWDFNVFWGVRNVYKIGIKVPDIKLRGISNNVFKQTLAALLRNVVDDESIEWQSFSNFEGLPYRIAWGVFATRSKNLDTWKEVLSSPIPKGTKKSDWAKLLAHWVLVNIIYSENYLDFFTVYKEAFPSFEGYIPIVLMNNIISITNHKEKNSHPLIEKTALPAHILKSTAMILECSIAKIIKFHKEIKSWNFQDFNYRKLPTGNLLDLFLQSIQTLADTEVIDIDPSKFNEIQDFITNIRNAIESKKE